MTLAFRKTLGAGAAAPAPIEESDRRLEVSVVFTSVQATLAALKRAAVLAQHLQTDISLVVAQVVPYPLPLNSPPVLVDFSERHFRAMAGETSVRTTVGVYLCRDRWELLRNFFRPHSLIVLGAPKRWWPTAEARLARRLRRTGHDVVLIEME